MQKSLVCHTDNIIGCCKTSNKENWYLISNGSIVTLDDEEFNVVGDEGQIRLYGKTEAISLATTLCCIIPDFTNTNQTLSVDFG